MCVGAILTCLISKLIDVSQANFTDDGTKMTSEYPRLFNERFPQQRPQLSRPPSPEDSADEDETAWLGNIIGNTTDTDVAWEQVRPIDSGALTVQFGEGLSLDRRHGR